MRNVVTKLGLSDPGVFLQQSFQHEHFFEICKVGRKERTGEPPYHDRGTEILEGHTRLRTQLAQLNRSGVSVVLRLQASLEFDKLN